MNAVARTFDKEVTLLGRSGGIESPRSTAADDAVLILEQAAMRLHELHPNDSLRQVSRGVQSAFHATRGQTALTVESLVSSYSQFRALSPCAPTRGCARMPQMRAVDPLRASGSRG